ncbi:MAG: hypothetical protein KDA24_03455 [Deltaproteobacteria bacterium]|nr:hypothetical protein [Deltaproteobacteria bacterium]
MIRRSSMVLVSLLAFVAGPACNTQQIAAFDLPPQVSIITPDHESVFQTPTVQFAGSVDDNDFLDEMAVVWTSSLHEEPLFEGNPDSSGYVEFTASNLVAGTHTIEFRVTDSAGQSDAESIDVTIATDPPQVFINEPQATFLYYSGSAVVFDGLTLSNEGVAGPHVVEWSSDIQGPIFSGSSNGQGVSEFDALLDEGTHLITLRASDNLGVTGQATVSITVDNIPLGQLDQDSDGFCPDGIDADGDGRCEEGELTGVGSQDCNDNAATVCPGCPEICDGFDDNNCDGVVDPDDQDLDADGWSPCQGDCDDGAPWNFPNNPEICDGLDNDCSGAPNFDALGETDNDGDNVRSCDDCDDNEAAAFPGNTEICDDIDNDCNGFVDDGFDQDSDGYSTCEGDCNDLNNAVNPGALEICNTIDDNCDGYINEAQAGPFEMWETGPNSPGYELSNTSPQLVFGTGPCAISGILQLQAGNGSVAGVFSDPTDLWDIYEFDTGLTSNLAAWLAFIASGSGLPASCQAGSISWTSALPITVFADIDGTTYSGTGTSGSLPFQLNILQLFDIDYKITVSPAATWVDCNYTYTLNFVIP